MEKKKKLKVGLLCNGRHTGTKEWEKIIWGKDNLMGQIPTLLATLFCLERPKEVTSIVFGTGASERDGIPEAQVMINFMMDNLHRLLEFPAFNTMTSEDIETLRARLKKITSPETTSKNTIQEFVATMSTFRSAGVELVADVTCPTHAPRCMRDIITASEKLGKNAPEYGLMVIPAQTHYASASINDVAILEPPHRGDTPKSFTVFHRLMMQIFSAFMKAMPEQQDSMLQNLAKIV